MLKTFGLVGGLFFLSLLPASVSAADPPAEAKAILDDGIKALGGGEKLAKLPATTFNSEGFLTFVGLRIESTSTWTVQYPDKYRYDGKIKVNESTGSNLKIGNGDKGWNQSNNDVVTAIEEDQLAMLSQDTRAVHLAHLLVPLTDKKYQLSTLGELKIDNRPALGLKIVLKNQPDLDLYFDKETHLPVRVSFACKEATGYDPVPHVISFGGYKEADGCKHFTQIKLFRQDKQILEMNLSNVKRQEKAEANLFEKP